MPAKKAPRPEHPKSAKSAERKFGKAARSAAEKGGKKPKVWRDAQPRRSSPAAADQTDRIAVPGEAIVSRSIDATASDVFRAFNDPLRRAWCHERGYAVRRAVAPRALTLGFADGSLVQVEIVRKGNVRCQINIAQTGFAAEGAADRARGDWRAALERLAGMLDE